MPWVCDEFSADDPNGIFNSVYQKNGLIILYVLYCRTIL